MELVGTSDKQKLYFILIANKAINILRYKLRRDGKKMFKKINLGQKISIWPDSSQCKQLGPAVSEQKT